jgi:site-specific recombinase XerD
MGQRHRHHLRVSILQRAVKDAVGSAGMSKFVSWHTLLHSLARGLLEHGYDTGTAKGRPGYSDVSTTMVYTHDLNHGARRVQSPLDWVPGPGGAEA